VLRRVCFLALVSSIAAATAGAAPPLARNGLIAFASDRAENNPRPVIYLLPPSGGDRFNLSRRAAFGPPAWSPNGRTLAFPAEQDILIVRRDGTRVRRLRVGKWSFGRSDLAWSPDGKRIAVANYGDDRLYVERLGQRPRSLVHKASRLPSWSPGGRLIAFVAEELSPAQRPLPPQLFLVQPNGRHLRKVGVWSNRRRWFDETDPGTAPSWSPTGRRLVFERRGFVRMANARTRRTRLVTRVGKARDPVWSPNGEWIAFERLSSGGNVDLYLVRPSGSGLRKVARIQASRTALAWSLDGARIAYYDGHGVSIQDLRTGESRPIDRPSCRERADWLTWSPRGLDRIAYGSALVGNDTEIFTVLSDGTGLKQLTNNCVDDRDPAWSPTGTDLAFARVEGDGSDLYLMSADGSSERRLTPSPSADRHPAWSPVAKRIAFDRRVSGSPQLFSIRPDGSDVQQITATAGTNSSPDWSPLGDFIVFASTRADPVRGESQIYTAHPDGSDQRRVTSEQYGAIDPDWSPDQASIAFVQQQDWTSGLAAIRPDGSGRRQLAMRTSFNPIVFRSPSWSPDNTAIVFSTIGALLLLPLDGHPGRTVIPYEVVRNVEPDWQPLP
jgi:Tol biopolymer transport system component